MLNAHPQMVAPPECGFIQWNFSAFGKVDFTVAQNRTAFAHAVLGSKKMETWGLTLNDLTNSFDQVAAPNYAKPSKSCV